MSKLYQFEKSLLSQVLHFFRILVKWPQQKTALEGMTPWRTAKQNIYQQNSGLSGENFTQCSSSSNIELVFVYALGSSIRTIFFMFIYYTHERDFFFLYVL